VITGQVGERWVCSASFGY